jgi:hypothetical protein
LLVVVVGHARRSRCSCDWLLIAEDQQKSALLRGLAPNKESGSAAERQSLNSYVQTG